MKNHGRGSGKTYRKGYTRAFALLLAGLLAFTGTDMPVKAGSTDGTEQESSLLPTPAVTATPSAAETPSATETPAATETPSAAETPAVTETPSATETPAVTETPAATETPAVTETPTEEPTPAPDPTLITAFDTDGNWNSAYTEETDGKDAANVWNMLPQEIKFRTEDGEEHTYSPHWETPDILPDGTEPVYSVTYSGDEPDGYTVKDGVQFPSWKFNITYTASGFLNWKNGQTYKTVAADFDKKQETQDSLQKSIEVTADGLTGAEDTGAYTLDGITWDCGTDIGTDLRDSYTYTMVLPSGWKYADGVQAPQIVMKVNKTVTGFLTADGTAVWDGKTPWKTWDTDYEGKNSAEGQFPTEIKAYINGGTEPVSLKAAWYTSEDLFGTDNEKYTFTLETPDGYTVPKTLTVPYTELNVSKTVTSFAGYDGTGYYASYRVGKYEKDTVGSLLPKTVLAYCNGTTEKTYSIPAVWKCDTDINTTSEKTYVYTMQQPEGYAVSAEALAAMPKIEIMIIDTDAFGALSASFGYTGKEQTYVVPQTGRYLIKTYGASGGGSKGGAGGYSYGYVNLRQGDTLYINNGGAGSIGGAGGYNGGGSASGTASGSGGGATSVAKASGLLSSLKQSDVLIVSGGGGGAGAGDTNPVEGDYTAQGGGLSGFGSFDASAAPRDSNTQEAINAAATGGKQDTGYAFGYGQDATSSTGAGGGGWYGGRQGTPGWYPTLVGGGGSGYVAGAEEGDTVAGQKSGNGYTSVEYSSPATSKLMVDIGKGGTWNGQSGTVVMKGTVGDEINVPNPDIKDGWIFLGWKTVSGTATVTNGKFTYEFGGTEIKAQWKAPLILTDVSTGTNLDLYYSEDDDFEKVYRVFQSADQTKWYAAASGTGKDMQKYEWSYGCVGATQTWTAPYDGWYTLEVWGAQGGGNGYYGRGGYAKGKILLTKGTVLYISVGQKPGWSSGGWNGGGTNGSTAYGGGGATDIAANGYAGSGSWYNGAHLYSRILVGGGGGGYNALGGDAGGAGGGWSGGSGSGNDAGSGGGQYGGGHNDAMSSWGNPNGYFGGGGSAEWCGEYLGAGGGGWFGGSSGGGHNNNGSGAGGSGYVYTAGSYKPGGYMQNPSYYLEDTVMYSGVQQGNGCARITFSDNVTADTKMNNVAMADTAAPNAVTGVYMEDADTDTPTVTWEKPADNGNWYYHMVKSYRKDANSVLLQTSNVVRDFYMSDIAGYRYYIDGAPSGTVTAGNTFTAVNAVTINKSTSRRWIHIAACDNAGNVGPTVTYEIVPITYYVRYASGTAAVNGTSDTYVSDGRKFYYGKVYYFRPVSELGFSASGKGYYGQNMKYMFAGWSFGEFSPYAGSDAQHPFSYLPLLTQKLQASEFMTQSPQYVPASVLTSPQKRIYYYDADAFKSLTAADKTTVTLYAEWVAENQRPYCGFGFLYGTSYKDGRMTGKLAAYPYDTYKKGTPGDSEDTAKAYSDTEMYITGDYYDPENMPASATEYQYSTDGGNTWYRLDGNSSSSSFSVKPETLSDGTSALGIRFGAGTETLIRMRTADTAEYPSVYTYSGGSYSKKSLQHAMWSTGCAYTGAQQYAADGKYLGDGTSEDADGYWYTKKIVCRDGNKAPSAALLAGQKESTGSTYAETVSALGGTGFADLPMYAFSSSDSNTYSDGRMYVLLSSAEKKSLGNLTGDALRAAWNNKHGNTYAGLYSDISFIEEGTPEYTDFDPEDETAAYPDESSDPDGEKHTGKGSQTASEDAGFADAGNASGHGRFAYYWIAVCRDGSLTGTDITAAEKAAGTQYGTDGNLKDGTVMTREYGGQKVTGKVYASYASMVKALHESSADLFPADTDSSLSEYDIYYAVCDKPWNRVSPAEWSGTERYMQISEPSLSFGDLTFSDAAAAVPSYAEAVSLYRNSTGTPYTHISSYTFSSGAWRNTVRNASGTESSLRAANMKADYTQQTESAGFAGDTRTAVSKAGVYWTFGTSVHGADRITVSLKNAGGNNVSVTRPDTEAAEDVSADGPLVRDTARKAAENGNFWTENTWNFGIPEQTPDGTFSVTFTAEKHPYTAPGKTVTRHITVPAAVKTSVSAVSDRGVENTD